MTDSKTTSGMRCWKVYEVRAECPYCEFENRYRADEFEDDELWFNARSEQLCRNCGKWFEVEVTDDDR